MRSTALRFALIGLALSIPTVALAGPAPPLVNQEGLLLRDGFPIDGEVLTLTFRFCREAEGGECVWTEVHEGVEIRSGYYSVILGSLEEITTEALDTEEIYLDIRIGDDPPLRPRQRMVSTPFAVRATVADNVDGDITPISIVTGNLTSTNGVFTNVTVNNLLQVNGNANITGTATIGRLNADLIAGNLAADIVKTASIENNAVTTEKIAPGAVSNSDIAGGAVNSFSIQDATVNINDIHPDVFDIFGINGEGGNRPFVINADLIDNIDSAQLLRSDIDDTAGGTITFRAGIHASVGAARENGITFQGPTSNAGVQLQTGNGGSLLVLANRGGNADGLSFETANGGAFNFAGGGPIRSDGGARLDGDLEARHGEFGGNLAVGGSGRFNGALSAGGGAIAGQALSVNGSATVTGGATVLGSLGVGVDLSVTRNITANGTIVGAVVTGTNGVAAATGNIHAQGRDGVGGDVVAARDLIAERDVRLGGTFSTQGLIQPSNGSGAHGIVFPGRGATRGYLQVPDGVDAIRLGNNSPGGSVGLFAGEMVAVRKHDDSGWGDLSTGGLKVYRNAEFRRDVDVLGNVTAIELTADLLTIENEVNVAALLTADELQANTIVVDPDGDKNPNTQAQGVGTLYADVISGTLADNMVTSSALANGIVTSNKLGQNSINSGHIIDGQVRNPDLAQSAVNSNSIADGSIAAVDMGANSIIASKIAADQIEDRHMRANTLTNRSIATGAIRSDEILDYGIQTIDLRDGAVDGRVLADNSITGDDIADGTLTGADIRDGTIHGVDLQDNTVTGADIQNGSLGNADFANDSVDARVLANNSVTSSEIANGTIFTVDLADNAVNSAKVLNNSLTTADILDNSLRGVDIQNGSLNGNDIANGGVFSRNIAANAINSSKVQDGTISRADLDFDPGVGGGGGVVPGGNIVFTENLQGLFWKFNGTDMWAMRREFGNLRLYSPINGQTYLQSNLFGSVDLPTGVNLGGAYGDALKLNGQTVLQNDRDMFARRLFLTGTSGSVDTSTSGIDESNYSLVFPRHSGGSRPQLYVKGAQRKLVLKSGTGGSDNLDLVARGGITADGPFKVVGPTRGGGHNPLLSTSPVDKWSQGYHAGYDPIVFTQYLNGYPGSHNNRGVETILIGRQPYWGSDYRIYVKMDFDNGSRMQISGAGVYSWEWWGRYGQGSRSHSWNRSLSGSTSPPGSDVDNVNTRSRYTSSHAWARGGYLYRRCWNYWGWRCWGYWNEWRDSDATTYTYFRFGWNPYAYPANAILARGSFWYRRRSSNYAGGWSATSNSQFYVWMFGRRGSRLAGNHSYWCCGANDTGWRKSEITPTDLFSRRIYEVRFDTRNFARGSWYWGTSAQSDTQWWVDSMQIEILTAQLSELQVYADATFWGSLHVKQDLVVHGRKFFVQDHPEDPNKEVAYIAIEGGEAGTYWRGSSRLEDGVATIPLPEHFSLVTSTEGVTATATLREPGSTIFVSELTNKRVVVKTADGSKSDMAFDFVVMGVRRGFENHVPIRYRDKNRGKGEAPMAGGRPGGRPGPGGMGGAPAMNTSFTPGR